MKEDGDAADGDRIGDCLPHDGVAWRLQAEDRLRVQLDRGASLQ